MRKRIEEKKIKESFEKVRKDIGDLKEKMEFIIEKIQSQTTAPITARTTACSTAPITARNKLKTSEKRLLKRLDSVKLMKTIQSHINQGHSTNMIKDDIMDQFDIKERCFYNHLKKVRVQLHITA